jgi:hypothetical protein
MAKCACDFAFRPCLRSSLPERPGNSPRMKDSATEIESLAENSGMEQAVRGLQSLEVEPDEKQFFVVAVVRKLHLLVFAGKVRGFEPAIVLCMIAASHMASDRS